MSRIGKVPIPIPDGVQASVDGEGVVSIKGPKGEVKVDTKNNVEIVIEDGILLVKRKSDGNQDRAYHGLYHRLITNAITGVTQGYQRELEITGVGFRAEMKGPELILTLGYSHPVRYKPAPGAEVSCPEPTKIMIQGIDKQVVNQAAAEIRLSRPPEPYKGKGIAYKGEVVRRKVGKAGAA